MIETVTPGCAVENCERPPRSPRSRYCEMHYYRVRRTGSTGPAHAVKRTLTSDVCEVDGCDAHRGRGLAMCKKHNSRVRRWGDPHHATPGTRGNPSTIPSYGTMHKRLRALFGRAAAQACVDCGGTAAEWSYDHDDPHELLGSVRSGGREYVVAYSTDPSHYSPRCVHHHREFDRNHAYAASRIEV